MDNTTEELVFDAARTPHTRQYRMDEEEMADTLLGAAVDDVAAVVSFDVVVVVTTLVFGMMGGTTGMTAGVISEYSRDNCSPVCMDDNQIIQS